MNRSFKAAMAAAVFGMGLLQTAGAQLVWVSGSVKSPAKFTVPARASSSAVKTCGSATYKVGVKYSTVDSVRFIHKLPFKDAMVKINPDGTSSWTVVEVGGAKSVTYEYVGKPGSCWDIYKGLVSSSGEYRIVEVK